MMIEEKTEKVIFDRSCKRCKRPYRTYRRGSEICGSCNKNYPAMNNYNHYPDVETIVRDKQILLSLNHMKNLK